MQAAEYEVPVDLLDEQCRGDLDSLCKLVRELYPRLFWTALRIVKDPADAEDVVQDALWKAFRHLADRRNEAPLAAWVVRIVQNQGIDLLRRRGPGRISLDHPLAQEQLRAMLIESRNPEQLCISEEMAVILRQCISRMPRTYGTILALSAFDELSNRQIAERLKITEGNVRLRMLRARRELRPILALRLARRSSQSLYQNKNTAPTEASN